MLPTGREVLVTAKYVRAAPLEPLQSVVLALRDAEGRRRAEAESAALLTAVAHELRSPLTGVKGFSSTLLRNWDRFTDDQKRLMLETIEADADRVTRLITELKKAYDSAEFQDFMRNRGFGTTWADAPGFARVMADGDRAMGTAMTAAGLAKKA